jgi:hypothetical protein
MDSAADTSHAFDGGARSAWSYIRRFYADAYLSIAGISLLADSGMTLCLAQC